jgi:hypothetical protein
MSKRVQYRMTGFQRIQFAMGMVMVSQLFVRLQPVTPQEITGSTASNTASLRFTTLTKIGRSIGMTADRVIIAPSGGCLCGGIFARISSGIGISRVMLRKNTPRRKRSG